MGEDEEVASEVFDLGDRKSTRLNSSHRCSSYAVFCVKKKIALIDECKAKDDTLGVEVETLVVGLPPVLGSYVQWDRQLGGRLAHVLISVRGGNGPYTA